MQTIEIITASPEVLGGTPVFAGTRVPVKNLTDYLEAGDTIDEFLEDFPSVSREQAIAMLEKAQEVCLPPSLNTRRVLLDECLPRKLKREFIDCEVFTVPEMGWSSKKNGELMQAARERFDVFITADQNL